MKIAIAGSGAIGCRFGFMLHEIGIDVILIDKWKEHIEQIRKHGLKVDYHHEDRTVKIPIYYPHEVQEKVDIVVVFTKAMGLAEMLADIRHILGENTKVVSLLNGVGHEDVLKRYVSANNIFLGVTIFTASLAGPGKVILHGSGTTEIQNFQPGDYETAAAREIVAIFDRAGLNASYSENVKFSIWRKACVNGAMNATCALLDCNLAQFVATDQAESIIREIVKEFVLVASIKDVVLDEKEMVQYILSSAEKVGEHYPSMHQDLIQNHRYTEVDFLNGAVDKLARNEGIATPYNRLVTQFIHAKEQILSVH